MAFKRSKVEGVPGLLRIMRGLPNDVRKQVGAELRIAAEIVRGAAFAGAPKRTGEMAGAIRARVQTVSLTAKIGFMGGGRDAWSRTLGRWHEYGTKGRPAGMLSHRGRKLPAVPPLPANPFLRNAYERNKAAILEHTRRAISIALNHVNSGGALRARGGGR